MRSLVIRHYRWLGLLGAGAGAALGLAGWYWASAALLLGLVALLTALALGDRISGAAVRRATDKIDRRTRKLLQRSDAAAVTLRRGQEAALRQHEALRDKVDALAVRQATQEELIATGGAVVKLRDSVVDLEGLLREIRSDQLAVQLHGPGPWPVSDRHLSPLATPGGRLLVTVFNRSSWSGLHENVLSSAKGLARRFGWDVTVAARDGLLVKRLRANGIRVHVIDDWADTDSNCDALSSHEWDVIHSHPFRSRELAQAIARRTGAPLVATFHGNYLDAVGSWGSQSRALVAVSRAHAEMLITAGAPRDRVFVVPNGVDDAEFMRRVITWHEKGDEGARRVFVVSRLDADKAAVLECIDRVVGVLAGVPSQEWLIEVAGDGSDAEAVRQFVAQQEERAPNLRFIFHGWIDSDDVPRYLSRSTLAIASGRGAATSLAVGTPVIAFGSQGVYGLQVESGLRMGLWGNFGGFPLPDGYEPPFEEALRGLLEDPTEYARAQRAGRSAAWSFLRQSAVDRDLDGILRL